MLNILFGMRIIYYLEDLEDCLSLPHIFTILFLAFFFSFFNENPEWQEQWVAQSHVTVFLFSAEATDTFLHFIFQICCSFDI